MYLVYECIFQLLHKSTGSREFSTKIRAVLEAPLLALQFKTFFEWHFQTQHGLLLLCLPHMVQIGLLNVV